MTDVTFGYNLVTWLGTILVQSAKIGGINGCNWNFVEYTDGLANFNVHSGTSANETDAKKLAEDTELSIVLNVILNSYDHIAKQVTKTDVNEIC